MALIAGADGDKSIFKDGMQVDHISENTNSHGIRIKGITDSTTYPILSGDIGEIVAISGATDYTMTGSYADWPNSAITLSAGIWRIHVDLSVQLEVSGVAGGYGKAWCKLVTSGGTTVNSQEKNNYLKNPGTNPIGCQSSIVMGTVVSINSATVYKIQSAVTVHVGGSAQGYINHSAGGYSNFWAVRIA